MSKKKRRQIQGTGKMVPLHESCTFKYGGNELAERLLKLENLIKNRLNEREQVFAQ